MSPPKISTTRLARRLFWPYRGRILFFSLCIALGTGSLFAVTNLLALVKAQLYGQARTLMAADVSVGNARPFTEAQQAELDRVTGQIEGLKAMRAVEIASMVRHTSGEAGRKADPTPFLASVKAVDPAYPLVGELIVDPPDGLTRFHGQRAALVSEALARERKVTAGDTLKLGTLNLTVAGVITQEPDAGLGVGLTFAPRVMVPYEVMADTGLLAFGSRVRHRRLYALPDGHPDAESAVKALADDIDGLFDDPQISVRSYIAARPSTERVFERLGLFFGMVALVTLTLAGIGVVVGVLSLLNEHLAIIGTLRCMGVGPGAITRAYLGLCAAMGLGGGLLGVGFGLGIDALLVEASARARGFELALSVSGEALLESVIVGLVLAVGFNLASIRALGKVSPQLIIGAGEKALRLSRWAVALLITSGLGSVFGYLAFKTGSLPLAGLFTGGLVGAALVCLLVIFVGFGLLGALHAVMARTGAGGLVLRHGVRQVLRHRQRSLVYLVTLGLGLALTTALGLIQVNLEAALQIDEAVAPNLFLVDVQPDQVETVQTAVAQHGEGEPTLSPLVRARLSAINGEGIDALTETVGTATPEARRRRGTLTREYNLTWRDTPGASEQVIAGEFWAPGAEVAEASLERRFADRLGVTVGDQLTFDVQGRPVEATVTSLRQVNWLSLTPNFFVVVSPHALSRAPHSLVGAVRAPQTDQAALLRQAVFDAHPNISVIDLTPIFAEARRLFGYVGATIQVMAALCALLGLLILGGTLQLGRPERFSQAGVLSALGMRRGRMMGLDVVEYTTVGALTVGVVLSVSIGLGWAVVQQMNVPFVVPDGLLIVGVLVPLALPLVAGLVASAPTWRRGAARFGAA